MQQETKSKVCIVGGGSSAYAIIAFLSSSGHEVSLLTRRPKEWSNHIALEHQSSSGRIQNVFEGCLKTITSRPTDVIPSADVILLCMPVSQYRDALHRIAPYIPPSKKLFLGTIYGQAGFNWMATEIIKKYSLKNVTYFAVGLIPWICRTKQYGKIGITYGNKVVNVAAVYPKEEYRAFESLLLDDLCRRWYQAGRFQQADNFISLTLSVDNQIIHPTRLYGLSLRYGGRWSRAEDVPWFYRDYDELSADLLSRLDEEYSMIRDAIKSRFPAKSFRFMLDYLALERLSYASSNTDICESFVKSETLGAIRTPVVQEGNDWVIDKNHRFFHDDIYYGLCVAKWIAERLDINTETLDSILIWAQKILNDNIIKDKKLMLCGNKKDMLFHSGIPSEYGYSTLEDIID